MPALQSDGLLIGFLNQCAGGTITSPALLGKIGRGYVDRLNAFADAEEIRVVRFTKEIVNEQARARTCGPPSPDRA